MSNSIDVHISSQLLRIVNMSGTLTTAWSHSEEANPATLGVKTSFQSISLSKYGVDWNLPTHLSTLMPQRSCSRQLQWYNTVDCLLTVLQFLHTLLTILKQAKYTSVEREDYFNEASCLSLNRWGALCNCSCQFCTSAPFLTPFFNLSCVS